MAPVPLLFARCLACGFFAILFLQSGLDKVTDRKGNLEYFTSHFANSPFKGFASPLLSIMTLLEIASGLVSAIGLIVLLWSGNTKIGFVGVALSGISLLCLFGGQRIAKDYAGAATLAIYMGVTLISLSMLV